MVQTRSQTKKLHRAASKVQKAFRAHAVVREKVDPITLEQISKPFFRCVDIETNAVSYFGLNSLIDFLECTGDFRHPITRRPLHPAQIYSLQKQAARAGRNTTVFQRMQLLTQRRTRVLEVESTLEFFLDKLEGMVNVVLEICSTADFTELEMMVMIVPWTRCFRDGVICLLSVLQAWQEYHDEHSIPLSMQGFGSRMVHKLSSALSSPTYYSEPSMQFVMTLVGEMLRARPTVVEWIQDVYVVVPPVLF